MTYSSPVPSGRAIVVRSTSVDADDVAPVGPVGPVGGDRADTPITGWPRPPTRLAVAHLGVDLGTEAGD